MGAVQRGDTAGGSLALGDLIDERGGALYRDLLLYYGVDLVDVVAGRSHHSPRLVVALIEWLPEDSAFAAAINGGRRWLGWTEDRMLRAALYDAMNANTVATGQWKKRPPRIDPWPRPNRRKRKPTSIAAIRRHFGRG